MIRSTTLAMFSALVASACQSAPPAPPRAEATVANRAPTARADPAPGAEPAAAPADAPRYSLAPQSDPDWPGSGGALLPVGVRVAAHDGYERVVFVLEGAGTPGWRVEYVDAAVGDPSGEEVEVEGDYTLQVVLTGVRYPDQGEIERLATGSFDATDTDTIEEVQVGGIFEGQSQSFVGVARKAPFRVFTLSDPPRVAIDFQSPAR